MVRPIPEVEERWLYLGAASGTTTSHVADLVGLTGRVYAIERSLRPFGRLLSLARRWPNLYPILADAREPRAYPASCRSPTGCTPTSPRPTRWRSSGRMPPSTWMAPARDRCSRSRPRAWAGSASAPQHVRRAEEELGRYFDLEPSVRLDPFHRGHYLVGGIARPELFGDVNGPRPTPRPAHSPGRSRR